MEKTNHILLITQKEQNTYLCCICGKTLGSMDTLKRHLKCHDETYNCPICKYMSLRRDAVKDILQDTDTHHKQIIIDAGLQ